MNNAWPEKRTGIKGKARAHSYYYAFLFLFKLNPIISFLNRKFGLMTLWETNQGQENDDYSKWKINDTSQKKFKQSFTTLWIFCINKIVYSGVTKTAVRFGATQINFFAIFFRTNSWYLQMMESRPRIAR